MSNQVITNYLADPSVPVETRRHIAAGLNKGDLSPEIAAKSITTKYGDKYGTFEPSNAPTPSSKSDLGGDIAKGVMGAFNPANFTKNVGGVVNKLAEKAPELGQQLASMGANISPEAAALNAAASQKREQDRAGQVDARASDVKYLNTKGISPDSNMSDEQVKTLATGQTIASGDVLKRPLEEFGKNVIAKTGEAAKQGVLMGAEGVQKVGAAITGDTSGLEGFRQFYGLADPKVNAIKQLTPEERAIMGGQGAQNFVSGTLGAAFSPLAGIVGATPGLKEGTEALGEHVINPVIQAGSGKLKESLKGMGIQLSPEQEASIDEGVGNIANLLITKFGEDTATAKALEMKKVGLQKSISESMQKGDLAAAKAAMAEYEAVVQAPTTITGRAGLAVGETVAGASKNLVEGFGASSAKIAEKVSKATQVNKVMKVDRAIDRGIEKGVKPSVSGKTAPGQMEKFKTNSRDAVKTIVENKSRLKLSTPDGEIISGELPKNLHQFREAIEQVKDSVFKKYDSLAKKAGEKGAKVDTVSIANELKKVADDDVLRDTNPGVAEYALQKAKIYGDRKAYTPSQAQQALKAYNDSLQAFYKNPTYDNFAKANIDSLIANKLRSSLDNAVTNLTGKKYQALKNQYGSLKAIEKDVNHRAIVNARQNSIGLVDSMTNVASAAEVLHGVLTANPQAFATGLAMKGMAKWIKHLNDPNVVVKSMFSKVDKGLMKAKLTKPVS